jgi:hypothetical protein
LRRPVNAVGIRCGKFWKRFLRRLPGINPELSKPEPAVSHAGATAGAEQVEGPGAGSSTACRDPLLAEATVETAAPIANVSFGLQGLGVRVVGGPCTTRWANLTVLAQSLVFLTIVALVIARTVNTLKYRLRRPRLSEAIKNPATGPCAGQSSLCGAYRGRSDSRHRSRVGFAGARGDAMAGAVDADGNYVHAARRGRYVGCIAGRGLRHWRSTNREDRGHRTDRLLIVGVNVVRPRFAAGLFTLALLPTVVSKRGGRSLGKGFEAEHVRTATRVSRGVAPRVGGPWAHRAPTTDGAGFVAGSRSPVRALSHGSDPASASTAIDHECPPGSSSSDTSIPAALAAAATCSACGR